MTADLSRIAKVSHCTRVAAPPEDLFEKRYKPIKQYFFDIRHILDFSEIKCFITQYFIRNCFARQDAENKIYLVRFDKYIVDFLFL